MRKLYCLLMALCFCVSAQALEKWLVFQDENGLCTVEVPVAPKVTHGSTKIDDGTEVAVTTYIIDRGESALIIMVADLAGRTKDKDLILDDCIDGVAGGKTLVSKANDELDGQIGRFAVITDSSGYRYTDRVFVVDGKLYQAMTVTGATTSADKRAEAERFNGSLHFPVKVK